jgi:hypothetical protein
LVSRTAYVALRLAKAFRHPAKTGTEFAERLRRETARRQIGKALTKIEIVAPVKIAARM